MSDPPTDEPRQEVQLPGAEAESFTRAIGVSVPDHIRAQFQGVLDRAGELERLSDIKASQIQLP